MYNDKKEVIDLNQQTDPKHTESKNQVHKHLNATYAAIKIIFIYLIIGFTWIITSDIIIDFVFQDHEANQLAQTVKGIFYVAFTAVIFFILFINKWIIMS